MTTNKGSGRSRKRKMTPIRRMTDELKKTVVYLVCTALVMSSISGSFAMAAQSDDDTDGAEAEIFEMDIESLCVAVESDVNDGNPLGEGEYEFTGSSAEAYEKLFDTEGGLLYEIYPDLYSDGDSIELRTFVKLKENTAAKESIEEDDDADADSAYIISGDEQIIFLLVNDTDDDAGARIQVSTDDETYETPLITVPGNNTSITLSTASLEMPMEYVTVDEKTENVKTAALTVESGSDAFYEETGSEDGTEPEGENEGETEPEAETESENESPEETTVADEMNDAASGSGNGTAKSSSAHSEGCISMSGTLYDAVRVNGESATAFVTTAKALGMDKLSADYGIIPLMDSTDSTFPIDTIYHLSVTWTTTGTDETVYSWTRDNHVTSDDNSDQSTIDALVSGSYRVRIAFTDDRSDQDLQVGESYVLALDWPTGEGVSVTPGGTSGTIYSSGNNVIEMATWELDPDTGEITIKISYLFDSENNFYIEFTATVEKANEPTPDGDNWEATGSIQKDGEIDELVYDKITYTITAVVPRYSLNGGKAYVWSIDDKMQGDSIYGGDYSNDMSDVEIVLTSTQYPEGIIIPSIENATSEDEYAYYVKVDSDKEDEIFFLNRCSCEETNCANWSDGCGNVYGDTGFCSCWLSVYNATFTITYSVDISGIIQGMEDHANASAYTQIMNSAVLYNGPNSPVHNDSDAEYVYRPFAKSETTNPDRNTENKGVGSYKIEISEHDIDYSWADEIYVTDVMDNLALVEDSLTVTIGNTVLTPLDADGDAFILDKETDRDKYYSYTYTDVIEDGEVTGGTLVIRIWYPTNQDITIEYQASVISYNTSATGDYSNAVTIAGTGYTLNGSYQEGSSGEGGSGLTLSMTLTKVDADDNDVVLPGAVFEIYRHVENDDDILVDTLTTGEDGTFTFKSSDEKGYWMDRDVLYYVKEIEAPKGYAFEETLYGFVFLRNGYEGTYPDGLDRDNVTLGEPDGDQIHIEITRVNTKEPKITKEIAEDDYERKEESGESMHDGEDTYGDGWGTWDDADNNQEVTYHITLTDIMNVTNITVHDYLEEGLDFEHEVEVVLYDGDTQKTLTESDYTMTEADCSDPNGCAMDGCTFEVEFKDSVFEDISSDAYIVISYQALTETHEEDYDDYVDEILNHSYMTYGASSYRSSIVTTATDLFGFGVYKYADENGTETALAGAEFILERNGVYATFETETDADTGEVYYMIYSWVEDKDSAGTLTSDGDGMIRIEGLDDDTYTITETKAPSGYEIVDETITVIIDEDGNVTVSGDTGSKEAVIGHVVNVENKPSDETDDEPDHIDVEGAKTWDDEYDKDGIRPESITVRLYADGEAKESVTVTEADGWKWSFSGLDKYRDDGTEIVYTVEEDAVNGYESSVDGYDITNTHTPQSKDMMLVVTKTVTGKTNDTNSYGFTLDLLVETDSNAVRETGSEETGILVETSSNATYKIYNPDESVSESGTVALDKAEISLTFSLKDGQSFVITGLPEGMRYTVSEETSEDYTTEVNGEGGNSSEGTLESDKTVSFVNAYPDTQNDGDGGSSGGGGGSSGGGGGNGRRSSNTGPGADVTEGESSESDSSSVNSINTDDIGGLPSTGEGNTAMILMGLCAVFEVLLGTLFYMRRKAREDQT